MDVLQTGMVFGEENRPNSDFSQILGYVVDKGSKYSVSGGRIFGLDGIGGFLDRVKSEKNFLKATHNSFAARVIEDGRVIERMGNDGETGAGMVILRILRASDMVDVCVVVTRWYGGVKLGATRFEHISDGAKMIVAELR